VISFSRAVSLPAMTVINGLCGLLLCHPRLPLLPWTAGKATPPVAGSTRKLHPPTSFSRAWTCPGAAQRRPRRRWPDVRASSAATTRPGRRGPISMPAEAPEHALTWAATCEQPDRRGWETGRMQTG